MVYLLYIGHVRVTLALIPVTCPICFTCISPVPHNDRLQYAHVYRTSVIGRLIESIRGADLSVRDTAKSSLAVPRVYSPVQSIIIQKNGLSHVK